MTKLLITRAAVSAIVGFSLALTAGTASYGSEVGNAQATVAERTTSSSTDQGQPGIQSAFGTQAIGSFQYSWNGITISVPFGCFLTHYINGDGVRVNYANVGTDCAGPGYWWGGFCNYQFKYQFYDLSGRLRSWAQPSPLFSSCDFNTFYHFEFNGDYTPGKACAIFLVGGVERARQCHNILA